MAGLAGNGYIGGNGGMCNDEINDGGSGGGGGAGYYGGSGGEGSASADYPGGPGGGGANYSSFGASITACGNSGDAKAQICWGSYANESACN